MIYNHNEDIYYDGGLIEEASEIDEDELESYEDYIDDQRNK
jgi:hypothetical protein